jgi:hypothetical protein
MIRISQPTFKVGDLVKINDGATHYAIGAPEYSEYGLVVGCTIPSYAEDGARTHYRNNANYSPYHVMMLAVGRDSKSSYSPYTTRNRLEWVSPEYMELAYKE